MTSKVLMLIQNSEWLQPSGDICLNLDGCKEIHTIFERVFLNVSASSGKMWKDVYLARQTKDQECYALLIISLLLIEKTLKANFDYTDEDVQTIVGLNLYAELEKYRES
jgi:hypothetical protein